MEGNIEAAGELIRDGLYQVSKAISFFARHVVGSLEGPVPGPTGDPMVGETEEEEPIG